MDTRPIFRTQYLIDRDFQLRYALLLAAVAIIVAVAIGGLFLYSLKESYEVLIKAGLTADPQVMGLIQHWKSFLSYNLVMILGMLIIFLTLLGILITHKMAGPIFVLKRKLKEIAENKCKEPMRLRNGDEFQQVKDGFNEMFSSLKSLTQQDIKALEALLEKTNDLELQADIKAIISKKLSQIQ